MAVNSYPNEGNMFYKNDSDNSNNLKQLIESAIKYSNTHPDSALINAKRAIQLASKKNEVDKIAEMNILIGRILEKQGNFTLAIEYLNIGLEVYSQLKDSEKIAQVRNFMGRVCADAFLFEVAMSHLEEALTIYKSSNDSLNLGITLLNIGYVHERNSSPYAALKFYEKAENINLLVKDETLKILTAEGKGSIYEDLGMYDKALEVYKDVLEVYDKKNNIYEKVDALNNVGDCYRKSGNAQGALKYYLSAYQLATERNVTRKIQQNALDLSRAYDLLNQKDLALSYLNKSMDMYLKIYDQKNISFINQMQILYEFDQKNKEIELQASRAKIQQWKSNMLIIGLSVFFLIIIFLGYSIKEKSKLNKILSEKNERIERNHLQLSQSNQELKELLEKLNETQDRLVHSEKMAAVGTLSAGIAHEINNPLNFIQGGITVIQSKLQNQSEVDIELKKLLSHVINGVERVTKIVKSLNSFSRKTEAKSENCDVHSIIDNCLNMLQYTIKGRIEIKKRYTKKIFKCIGNEGNLHQVFLNLLTNSVQSIRKEGTIEISSYILSSNLVIEIQDSGLGIKSEIMSKIKDPFFTTKDPGEGTGLGLSISNRILEDHGGSLVFESEIGLGTTAIITLPIII